MRHTRLRHTQGQTPDRRGKRWANCPLNRLRSITPQLLARPVHQTGLRNQHSAHWLGHEEALEAAAEQVEGDYTAARERGDFDIAGVIAGEACALIHDIPQAGEIVKWAIGEAERLIPLHQGGVGKRITAEPTARRYAD
jgi:hypothetical protein